ncbi:isoprenylcysteine carboxylmethyltransferase family protein [Candidatus Thorarchaeota archaeon]|nr:MAG: isoprenylcysteine carboxylmethyltransferase family protein [Candidatus Thorarchaeota archaeon]
MERLIAWFNLLVLVGATLLFLYVYVKSVSPVQLEQEIGEEAWEKCKKYRMLSGVFEFVTFVNYAIYFFFPLRIGLPLVLPWEYWISVVLAMVIFVFGLVLMSLGIRDAGKETLEPRKEHGLHGGIYNTVRHPQAIGESILWFPFALLLNSPFLVLYSFVWLPIFYLMCLYEERDLILRFGEGYQEYRERVGFILPKRGAGED